MHIYSISDTAFEQDLRWLFESVTNYLDVPKRILGRLVPYHFAGRVMVLYDFARGLKSIDRRYVEEVMCDYARMMTLCVLDYTRELTADDDDDDDTPPDEGLSVIQRAYEVTVGLQSHACAVVIMGAYARAKLNERRALIEIELMALTGLDKESANRNGIASVQDCDGQYQFDCNDIKQYLLKESDVSE